MNSVNDPLQLCIIDTKPRKPHFGIINQYCSDSSAQNGKAECINCTLADRTLAMLFHAKLPLNIWGELWYTALYLHNKSPSSSDDPHCIPKAIYFNYDA
jgi:hypothetical protein